MLLHIALAFLRIAVPGSEFSGVVAATAGDTAFKIGDRVFGGGALGAYAEQVVVTADSLLKMPSAMSFEEACCISLTWPTSYAALFVRGNLRAGEVCVVLAAAGGVGLAAGSVVGSNNNCSNAVLQYNLLTLLVRVLLRWPGPTRNYVYAAPRVPMM